MFLNSKNFSSNFRATFNITVLALYLVLVFISQIVLFFVPNVELVTLLIAYSVVIFKFGFSLSISLIFCFL
ncbi:hypothetical protein [Spiroplasma taiwanense]|uniref:hypothetical protein n=1 Tax=Spiroplasma taiwanense TaxID=2145 RepID=UPI0011D1BBA0|nr:hypothetical protein [Spiroplasma taiwanense]